MAPCPRTNGGIGTMSVSDVHAAMARDPTVMALQRQAGRKRAARLRNVEAP